MACVSKAVIIGGGFAGLATGISLAKAGVQCDVLELAAEPHGAALGINGRAAEALVELGIYNEVHETGRPWVDGKTASSFFDAQGQLIHPGPSRPSWPGAKTPIGVHRPVFLRILAAAAEREGVNIRRGVTAKAIDPNGDASHVVLTDGTVGHYDLIVGADGISSSTRRTLFPEAGKPTYSGQISIRWMAPGPPISPEGWYTGPRGKFGFYYVPPGFVGNWAVLSAPEGTWLEGEKLYHYYADFLESFTAPAVKEIRRRLKPDSLVICRPFEWILLSNPWTKGQAIMIGDAAHATTAHLGMGGGMALEDAVVLGQCIASATTLDEAFSTFMERRYERVRIVVESSVALSNLEQKNAPASENMAFYTKAVNAISQPY